MKDDDLAKQIVNHSLADVSSTLEEGKWTLVFTREFGRPPERLWDVLTQPEHLAAWSPFGANRNLGAVGPVTLSLTDGDQPVELQCAVSAADKPRLLEYTWGVDRLRWELVPIASGTRLVLRHTVKDRHWLPKVGAGWHICLFVADRLAAGHPVRRIVGMDAMDYGWPELHEAYAEKLGVEATPMPQDRAKAKQP